MEENINKLVDQTVEKISEVCEPKKIILFGSANSDEFGINSDLDFLVVVSNQTDKRKLTQMIYKNILSIGFATDILLIDEDEFKEYKDFDGYIIKTIIETGRVIYG